MWFKSFLQSTSHRVVSGDKMMNKALGPVWHTKQKAQGIIPARLRGVDREATWGHSHYDGWVYGHGSFCLVSHRPCVLGAFKYIRNSAHEAKRLWLATGQLRGVVETVIMDSKADDQALFAEFRRQRGITLVTTPRKNSAHTAARRRMISVLNRPRNRRLRQQRGQTVEPMQGVVKDIFALERCWMRGHRNNRWLFAAMGVTVQMHQARALKRQHSVWKIKQEVLGL
jgi:DDE family transposase